MLVPVCPCCFFAAVKNTVYVRQPAEQRQAAVQQRCLFFGGAQLFAGVKNSRNQTKPPANRPNIVRCSQMSLLALR